MSSTIENNIAKLRQRIAQAAQKYGRNPDHITLLAVSKTRGADEIAQAVAAGIDQVGENYLQEALDKMDNCRHLPVCWHFIGPIQSNKTRAIAERFDWVESVDRLKIAQRLSDQRPPHLPPLNICLQVNISGEASKSGVPPDQLMALADAVALLPQLRLRGLMAIPLATQDEKLQRQAFAAMFVLYQELQARFPGADCLSMGMSADMEMAIAEGSNWVRIGTDLFGPRAANHSAANTPL